jgi:hypothetical protein
MLERGDHNRFFVEHRLRELASFERSYTEPAMTATKESE